MAVSILIDRPLNYCTYEKLPLYSADCRFLFEMYFNRSFKRNFTKKLPDPGPVVCPVVLLHVKDDER